MNVFTFRMLLRSIRGSIGRFLAILAIVALGVGLYAGLKTSQPDMLRTADAYLHTQKLYDFQLLSSLGLTGADVNAFRQLPGVSEAEGACFADAYARTVSPDGSDPGSEEVLHFQTLTRLVSTPALQAGRMPQTDCECLADSAFFSEADIGKTLVLTDSNSEDILSHFSVTEFEIVGTCLSPRYLSTDRGTGELGSGKIAGFVLLPSAAFADEVFHEVLLWCDLPGALYSEEYSDAVRHLRPAVETLFNRRGVLRQAGLREEAGTELIKARRELDAGWTEYRLGKRKALEELAAAESKLNASQTTLDASRKTLEESESELKKQEANLQKKQDALAERAQILSEDEQALLEEQAARSELDSRASELKAREAALEASRFSALQPSAAALAEAYASILILQGQQAALQAQLLLPGADTASLEAQLIAVNAALIAAEAARDTAQRALDAAEASQDAPDSEYSRQQQQLKRDRAQLEADMAAFEPRRAMLELAEQSLKDDLAALAEEYLTVTMTQSVLTESKSMLAESRAEFDSGARQLADGWAEYEAGKKKAEEELAEAERKLQEAEQKLRDGEAELEDVLQLDLYTLDRTANSGYVTFENDSAVVDGIAVVFPLFFVLIAGLVCVTTMTRMVNEERTQIGTMKAMGYAPSVITAKYLLYAGLSSLLGCTAGFFLGSTGLPYLVWYAYSIMYRYSALQFHLSAGMFLACLGVSVLGSLSVTWYACRSALTEKPAELIRPKAPPVGRRILLERVPALWGRLSFLAKVSLRNAFRYPSRVLMMLLGIGGCTALMVAGFGCKDSLAGVGDFQYDEISLYDIVVTLDPDKSGSRPEALWEDWAEHAALLHREEIRLLNTAGDGKDTELFLTDGSEVAPLLSLHEKNGTGLPWPGPGEVIITRKLSDKLNLKPGDRATLRLENGTEKPVTVSGVCEYYIGHGVYTPPDGFSDTAQNRALIRVRDGEDAAYRAARLRSEEGISYVSLTQTERETLAQSMASIDLLVIMLVFSSGALAFITLYNLTNINIMERIREVATVKVLGFTPRETGQYILNENLLLSFLGAAFGLLLGKLFHRFVMLSLDLDYMTYDIRIASLSYVMSFLITLVFALLTNLVMRRKLEKVNMAESLKSVE